MTNKKQLNQEQLESVSGGRGGGGGGTETTMDKWKAKVNLGPEITIYETEKHTNKEVFIAADNPRHYYIGTLTASWEDTYYRKVTVKCKIGSYPGEEKTIDLKNGSFFGDSEVWLVNSYK